MTIPQFLIPFRLTSFFLLLFFWLFLPHRYKKTASLGILLASYLVTGVAEYAISLHIARSIDAYGCAALGAEVLIVLLTAMAFGEHRDSRSLFMGLCGCTFSLAALIFGCLIYYYSRDTILSLLGQSAFSLIVLAVLSAHDRRTPLTELLADKTGRWQLCFIPIVCFLSIFVAAVWPGNIFIISSCRPITVIMLLLMFLYYYLVVALLRTQLKNNWLNSNNEILNAYTHGMKQQIEQTKKTQEELSILRHDIRHRANLVLYYLNEGNTDALRELFTEVNAKLDEAAQTRYCEDSALNWILDSSAQKAAGMGVRFECQAEIPPLPEKMELEFGTVVLNLIENALRAAAACPEGPARKTSFSVRPVKGQAFLSIDNAYTGAIRFSPVTHLPLSERGEEHGYGLRSVLAFAQNHQATLSCTADGGIFRTRLLIPLTEEMKKT